MTRRTSILPKWLFSKRHSRGGSARPLQLQQLDDRLAPAVFLVNSLSDVTAPDGNLTLREAMTSLNLGNNSGLSTAEKGLVSGAFGSQDAIYFAAGLTGTITITGSALPALTRSCEINGPGADKLNISGNNAYRVLQYNAAGTYLLAGVTITGGRDTTTGGAGVRIDQGALTISECVITGNSAISAGGILNAGTLVLNNTTVASNTGSLSIGGVSNTGTLTAFNTTFSGNSTTGGAGALFHSAGSATLTNCTIAGNTAGSGGGILANFSNLGLTITNCTITGNSAASGAGGVFRGPQSMTIDGSIISGNTCAAAPDIGSTGTVAVNFSAIGSGTGFTPTGANNLPFGTNLKLGGLAANGGKVLTILPAADSPVRDAGSNVAGLSRDARDFPRTGNGQADIGAVELRPLLVVRNTGNSGPDSLRQAILDANAFNGPDTVTFDATTFATPRTITLTTGALKITSDASILGPGAGLLTVNGNNNGAVFYFDTNPLNTASLVGVTVTGGKQAVLGGGGVFNETGTLSIQDSVITGNSATEGGGILNNGTLSLHNSTVSFNSSFTDGGGILNFGTLTATNSTISGNFCFGLGGGLANRLGAAVTLVNSTLLGNSAGTGGGLHGDTGAAVTIRNSTLTYNSAATGGGIARGNSALTIDSSIVSGNTAATAADISATGTVAVNFSAIGSNSGFTLTGANNLPFGANLKLRGFDFHGGPTRAVAFEFDSPLRNAGSNVANLATDQRGFPRSNAGVDIGAFELNTHVTNTADSGAGSLRAALAESNRLSGADTIAFDSSFNTAKTIVLASGEMVVSDAVTITGKGAALTTISGSNASRIFNTIYAAANSPVVITGLTLTGGSSTLEGGAILFGDEFLTVQDCVFTGNSAEEGGAIDIDTGTGTLVIDRCTFTGNTSKFDGGAVNIDLPAQAIVITNSTFSGNTASGSGGGCYTVAANVTIRNTTFSGNTSNNHGGGAFILGNGIPLIQNSTFSGNTASDSGGGLASDSAGALTLQNCTIVGNTAATGGGGVRFGASGGVITSTIISGNVNATAPDIKATAVITLDASAIGSLDGWTYSTGTGNLDPGVNLKLGPLLNNGGPTLTHLPALDSPLRGQGSNPANLATDQRGLPRTNGTGTLDIGATQVRTTSVTSMTRTGASPTIASTVGWTVTLASAVTGVGFGNFVLTGDGAVGASIISVSGSGTTYTVTAVTGSDGPLNLVFAQGSGINLTPANLPFTQNGYFVNRVALGATLTGSKAALTDANVGTGTFTITAAYSEAMDTTSTPAFSFPVESPGAALVFQSGAWANSKTYVGLFNVADTNLTLPNIDVRITGGRDAGGNLAGSFTKADLFSIDSANPYATSFQRNDPLNNKLANVSWTVTFSEPVTGVTASAFALFNGGLSGAPTISSVAGSGSTYTVTAETGGSGAGTLALVTLGGGTVADLNGNPQGPLAQMGGSYNIDFVSPAAAKLTLNTMLVNDASVGPNGFTAALKFNELMNTAVAPVVTFPATSPGTTLTASGGAWLDAYTYQARFNVSDQNAEINDISIRFSGAQDLAGNVQAPFDAADVLDIDTRNPIVASITTASPNGTYTVGQTIDVTLNFSEQIELNGTLGVVFNTGVAKYISGVLTGNSLSGTYTVGAGDSANLLNVFGLFLISGTLRDTAANAPVLTLPSSNLANNAAITVDGSISPTITVNNGATQRSRITSIAVTFDSPVSAANFNALGAITLVRTGVNSIPVVWTGPAAANHITVTQGNATTLILTFDNNGSLTTTSAGVENGSLTDGYWQLVIAGFQSPLNSPNLRRLAGDADANGVVNSVDLTYFGNDFNTADPTFDFDGNGVVNSVDLTRFGNQFNVTL